MRNSHALLSRLALTGAVVTLLSAPSHAAFNITVNFATTPTATQQAAFAAAEARWESLITGYITPGVDDFITSLSINASIIPIDGRGGTLGQAGPTNGINDGTYIIATEGEMEFDTADVDDLIAAGTFNDVILHEMAHVIGLGTLWTQNGVYVDGSGQYTGANAINAFRFEYNQPGAMFVPVELDGGPGTANGHWDERSDLVDRQGRPLTRELMTGFLNSPTYISQMTVQSFRDIGYTTVPFVIVPEPGTAGLLMFGGVGLVGAIITRRRK
jgi:hypothetical protein